MNDLIKPLQVSIDTVLHTLQQDHQLDPSQIKTDTESLEHWGKDWSKYFAPAPTAIVFPKTPEQPTSTISS